MQKTYKHLTAAQILARSTDEGDGRKFVVIDGVTYRLIQHSDVELANGDRTDTLVLDSASDGRIVLRA